MLCELLRKLQSQKETLVDLKAVKAPIHGSQTDPHTSKPGGPESCRKWLEHHITRRSMEYDGIIFEFCVCVCCTFCRVVFFSICGSHILAPSVFQAGRVLTPARWTKTPSIFVPSMETYPFSRGQGCRLLTPPFGG